MLASLTPKQLQEWSAYEQLEPFAQPWQQTSLQIAETLNGFRLLLYEAGVIAKPDDKAFIKGDAYVPKATDKPPVKRLSLKEAEHVMRGMCGV